MILSSHGPVYWVNPGKDKYTGPYVIAWNRKKDRFEGEQFGSSRAKIKGSPAQLEAFYTSSAVWWALQSFPTYLFEDTKQAKKIIIAVSNIAHNEMDSALERGRFDQSSYQSEVQSRANKWLTSLTPTKKDEPVPEKLTWRTASSGRLDAFSDHGSYHISQSTSGYQVRWLWKDKGALVGTFASLEKAKQAAEKHYLSVASSSATEPFRKNRKRRTK